MCADVGGMFEVFGGEVMETIIVNPIKINRRQVDHYGMSVKGVDHPRFCGTLFADVTIDNARSDLTINIDNGEVFNYRWNAMGHPGQSFKEFLISSGGSVDYFKGKVADKTVFDAKGTLAEMKRHLIEYRREDSIDADQARRVWNIIFGVGVAMYNPSNAGSFEEFYREVLGNVLGDYDQEAMDKLWDHPGQYGCYMKYKNTIDAFFDILWPELMATLKGESS
jgi:hypothetical protein